MKTAWTMAMLLVFALTACESDQLGAVQSGKTVPEVEVTVTTPEIVFDWVRHPDKRLALLPQSEVQATSLCTAIAPDEAMLAGLSGTTLTIVYADGSQKSTALSFPMGAAPSFPKGVEPESAKVRAHGGLVLVWVRGAVDEDGNPMEPDPNLGFKCNWKTYISLFDSDLNLLWEAGTPGQQEPRFDASGGVWLYGYGPSTATYMTPNGFKLNYEESFLPLGAPVNGKVPVILYSYDKYNWPWKHWGWFDLNTTDVKFFGQPSFGAWPEPQQDLKSYGHVVHNNKMWGLLDLCNTAQFRYLTPGPDDQMWVGIPAGNLSKSIKSTKHVEKTYFSMSLPTSSGWLIVQEQFSKLMTRVHLPNIEAGEQNIYEEVIDQTFPEGFKPYSSYMGQSDDDGNVTLVLHNDTHGQLFRYPIGGTSWEPVGAPMPGYHTVSVKPEPGALIAIVRKKKMPVSIPSWAQDLPGPDEHIQLIGRPGDGLGAEKTIILKSPYAEPDIRGRCVAFEQEDESGQRTFHVLDWDNNATIHSIDASFRQMVFVN